MASPISLLASAASLETRRRSRKPSSWSPARGRSASPGRWRRSAGKIRTRWWARGFLLNWYVTHRSCGRWLFSPTSRTSDHDAVDGSSTGTSGCQECGVLGMSPLGTTQTFRAPPRCVSLALRFGHSHQESQLASGAVGQRIRLVTAGLAWQPTPLPGVPPAGAGNLLSDLRRKISDFLTWC